MQSTEPEVWKPTDTPGYDVSDAGRVRGPHGVLRPFSGDAGGHLKVDIGGTRVFVHRLVLTAFVGPCPDGMEACHGIGGATDNRAANLRWDTRSANVLDLRSARTHCPHGHEFTDSNTYIVPSTGHRRCRQCKRLRRAA